MWRKLVRSGRSGGSRRRHVGHAAPGRGRLLRIECLERREVLSVGLAPLAAGAFADWAMASPTPAVANHLLTPSSVAAASVTSLTGTVTYNGSVKPVSIHSYIAGTPIQSNVQTWIVIHGRNSSPDSPNLVNLEKTLAASDQVLVLDWSSAAASGLLGGAGENYIKPVATWASKTLTAFGLPPDDLNLAGHSWGAYVAAKLAEDEAGAKVHSIMALDPAIDYPGGSYNPTAPNEVNFALNSNYSWAFYAYGGLFGTPSTAQTANESFVVKGTDHSNLVNVVVNALTVDFAGQFDLSRLMGAVYSTAWVQNSYDSSGHRSSSGKFEAVITATSNGLGVYSLTYVDMTTHKEVVVT